MRVLEWHAHKGLRSGEDFVCSAGKRKNANMPAPMATRLLARARRVGAGMLCAGKASQGGTGAVLAMCRGAKWSGESCAAAGKAGCNAPWPVRWGEIYSGRVRRGERVQMQKKRPRGSGFGACSGGESLYDQAA